VLETARYEICFCGDAARELEVDWEAINTVGTEMTNESAKISVRIFLITAPAIVRRLRCKKRARLESGWN
jgi:hypothetical protein